MNIKSVTRTRVYGGQSKGDWYRIEYKSGVSRKFRVEDAPNTVREFVNAANAETKDRAGHHIVYTA